MRALSASWGAQGGWWGGQRTAAGVIVWGNAGGSERRGDVLKQRCARLLLLNLPGDPERVSALSCSALEARNLFTQD